MYNYLPPFLAVNADGSVVLFDDLAELCDHYPWLRRQGNIGDHHAIFWPDGNGCLVCCEQNTWVIRDDAGRSVSVNELHSLARARAADTARLRKLEAKAVKTRAGENGHPVPGTGRKRGRFGTSLRHPQTLGELKANAALEADDELPVPTAYIRTRKYIPTAYDDLIRNQTRTWKRYRRTQWRSAPACC